MRKTKTMKDDYSCIEGKLRAFRNKKGLTQKNVAELLDVSEASISSYETGMNNPPINVLAKLAGLYNVSTDYLLGISHEDKAVRILSNLNNDEQCLIIELVLKFIKFCQLEQER